MRKIIKKFYAFHIWRYEGSKGATLISFILNIKKDFDYLSLTSQWHNNFEWLWSDLQLFTSLFPPFSRSDFIAVLPQITYGNMTLIFLSYFHAYNKMKYLAIAQ
jgi:hypothetical protein